ncbi:hypothetical protein UUA_14067 [Rhodanobacter thiooxydans LCS2]|nr:hypothetical protein UUA_14067 [Rhodanobacter thiooxydans LCS2]
MEAGFGHDFSDVRVHTSDVAHASARTIHALAYTSGQHLVFADGQYAPGTSSGRRLIAHELAHVVQQHHLSNQPMAIGEAESALEQQADQAAERVLSGNSAGRLSGAARAMIARYANPQEVKTADGGIDQVFREVTPGHCELKPETRTDSSSGIDMSSAFLELDLCRGNTAGQVRGEIDYGDALKQAGQIVGRVLSSAAPGTDPTQLRNLLLNELKQLAPAVRLAGSVQIGRVFAGNLEATGSGNAAGDISGSVQGRVRIRDNPVEPTVTVTVEKNPGQNPNVTVTGGITIRPGATAAPDCRKCACGDPKVNFTCTHTPPRGKDKPPPKPADSPQPQFFPYFFRLAETAPNEKLLPTSQQQLRSAVNLISQGFTIARVEGSASPEGPESKQRGTFKGNAELAQRRAVEGKRLLDEEINKNLHNVMSMRTEPLSRALSASYPVVGRGEILGSDDKGEVADKKLDAHLKSRLAPTPDEKADPLQQEHVIGSGLSAEARQVGQEDVDAFRTGKRGKRALTRDERMQAIYEPLRRALIVLNPPPPEPPDLNLPHHGMQGDIANTRKIECMDRHRALFAGSPIDNAFEGECRMPGKSREK